MSEHTEPRAAIIGAGLMGRWHADAVRKVGGRVTVIVDPNDAAREALGRRHPEARLVAEVDASLLARHATAAHVCTPLSTHLDIVSTAIEAGLHTLVEKPFARNAEETAPLLGLAEQRGVITCPVHQFVFQEGVRQITEWLPSLGRIHRVDFSTCSAGARGIDPASLDQLIADYAKRFAGGDLYYTPIVKNPQGGDTLVLYFEFDEDQIAQRTKRQLEIVARILSTDAGKKLTLTGHTDALGGADYNTGLSSRRADIVRDFLVSSGVAPGQIITQAKGMTQPRRPNVTESGEDNPEGRRANRRTEIYLDF